jgi:hypothetical protein
VTPLNQDFPYQRTPSGSAIRALDQVREVYCVRRIHFDDKMRTVQVEYDASRLHAYDVAALLTDAGIALRDRPPPAGMGASLEPRRQRRKAEP